jgi:N-methylhydantoinase B
MASDPITVSVIQHRLESIVQEMGEAMLRTAYSQILNSSRDFSTAVFDGQGRLAAQAEHVPIHVGALPWAVSSVADFFKDRIAPGDLFLLNDPYHGNNHLPDLTVLLPVFVGDRPVFWSINRAHQHDIGGATHGAYNPGATEIWQEGIRITPLKLYDRGVLRDDVLQMVATNVRHPRDFQGDLRAMMGSARIGERRLLKLVDDYGLETVLETIGEILDGAERQTRECIRGWKDGVFKGEAILDDDGHGINDVHIRAAVTKKGDSLTVDLTDSHDQVIGFVNSAFPNTMSAVHMALAYLIDPRTPKNEGTFRPVTVKARQGTVVWPFPPAPVTLSTNHCAQEIAEAMIKALARSCPDRVLAGWSRRFRIAISGTNPGTSAVHLASLPCARRRRLPGWRRLGDGGGGAGGGGNQVRQRRGGGGALSAVLRAPRVSPGLRRRWAVPRRRGPDLSCAWTSPSPPGQHRRGRGPLSDLWVLGEGRASIATDAVARRARVKTKEVGIPIRPGAVFLVESMGGGGYGPPARRPAEARAADRVNGFVSAKPRRGKA